MEKPKPFKGDGEHLPEFEMLYRQYVDWEGLTDKNAVKFLAFSLQGEAWDCYKSLSPESLTSLDSVFGELKKRFCGTRIKIILTEKLRQNRQGENESVNNYISRFHKIMRVLNLEESQKVSEFITNLQGDLKEHLIINYPKHLV